LEKDLEKLYSTGRSMQTDSCRHKFFYRDGAGMKKEEEKARKEESNRGMSKGVDKRRTRCCQQGKKVDMDNRTANNLQSRFNMQSPGV
jgi:hypothetical protein